jgi:hypothetical protein
MGIGSQLFGGALFGVGSPLASQPPAPVPFYLRLFTSEYQNSVNLLAWALANVQMVQDALTVILELPANFSLPLAVGPQLDALGVIVGQSRTVGFQPTGGVSATLDDDTYRVLLKARILQNHWPGTSNKLRAIWSTLFPGSVLLITDHQDMTVTLYVAAPFTSIIKDLVIQGYIIPRPQGVLYTLNFATLPLLGFDRNDAFVAGLDVGHFA